MTDDKLDRDANRARFVRLFASARHATPLPNLEQGYLDMLSRAKAAEAELASGSFYKETDIDAMQDEIATLKAERDRLREALTPSGDTKAAYMGEVECACPTETWRHHVPWTTTKAIMAMIRARAALKDGEDRGDA